MANEQKTYLVNVKSNLDKYADQAAKAGAEVKRLTAENIKMQGSDKATTAEKEKSLAALKNAQAEYKRLQKLVQLQTQANNSEINSRKQLNAIVTLEQQRLGALANTTTINSKGQRVLTQEYINQVKALSDAKKAVIAYDQAQKDGRSNVGRYAQSIVGLGKNLLQTIGIFTSAAIVVRAFIRWIGNAFKTTFQFEKAMSEVQAILRVTKDDMIELTRQAITLGSATKFTASEVAGLQKEYAKLGFTMQEIIKITPATLDLAAAAGTDLSTAASVAGSTLRQFSLDSSEMTRVVDVMTLSFSTSALDIQKWQDSMKTAGPVAAAVGDTIEDTAAKLAILANRGLDASTSGTSLRNIYLELEKRGLSWSQAMLKVQGSQNKASTALELFGKRGAVAGIILANNTELVKEQTSALLQAEGVSKEMATVMLDNVAGSITKLKSAWEGLILRINDSSGAIKTIIDLLTRMVALSGTLGKKNYEALADIKEINSVTEQMIAYSYIGLGKIGSKLAARLTSYEQTMHVVTALTEKIKEQREWDALVASERARFAAEKKKQDEEEAKRIQEQVDREEKLAEERKKQAKEFADFHKKFLEEQIEAEYQNAKDAEQRGVAEMERLAKNYEERQALREKDYQAELINQQNLLETKQYYHEYEFALKREALEMQYQAEIDNAKKTGADLQIIADKYAAARQDLDEQEVKAKYELYASFAGNLATIFGENTAIGRAAAAAQTAIATYTAAMEAYKSLAGVPVVGPALGIAAAAAATVAGIKNIKKILSTKSGLPGDTGGGAGTRVTPTVITNTVTKQVAPSAYFNQPQLTQPQLNAIGNQNNLTAEDIVNAIKTIPPPIVTVEDINAKIDSSNKIEVRANI